MLNYPISTLPLLPVLFYPLFILFQTACTSPPHPVLLLPPQNIIFNAALHLQIITLLPETPSDKQSMCACQFVHKQSVIILMKICHCCQFC